MDASEGMSIFFLPEILILTHASLMLEARVSSYLDGLVHSIYKYNIIISTPNMLYIPEFPEIEDVGIYLRGDGFYGPQEFTRWPQIFTQSLSHYCVIPAKPIKITDRFWNSVLFRNFTKADWTPLSTSEDRDVEWTIVEYAGGFLNKELRDRLSDAFENAVTTCLSGHEDDNANAYALARALRNLGRSALDRLRNAPDSASQVIFAVRDVQRLGLELHSIYEWMTVIRSRLSTRSVFRPGQYLGCFSSKPAEVEMLYRAGVPIWFLRTRTSITDSMQLGKRISDVPISGELELQRWKCVNGSYLHLKEIKDGGRLRDCTGLVYDGALSELMESVKTYLLFALNNRVGGLKAGESSLTTTGTTSSDRTAVGKRKGSEL